MLRFRRIKWRNSSWRWRHDDRSVGGMDGIRARGDFVVCDYLPSRPCADSLGRRMLVTGCGETSERHAAYMHGAVGILYAVMLWWHLLSVWKHWNRE